MGKINSQLTTAFSFRLYLLKMSRKGNAGDGISETLNLKNFLGEHTPLTPPGLGRLRNANFSPGCTFKISRYAADYRYLVAFEIIAQGWKNRLGLEGIGRGRGCILKIIIARGGTIFICNSLGGG